MRHCSGRTWAVPALCLLLAVASVDLAAAQSGGNTTSASPPATGAKANTTTGGAGAKVNSTTTTGNTTLDQAGQRVAKQLYDRCCMADDSCQLWKQQSQAANVAVQNNLCALTDANGQRYNQCNDDGQLIKLNMQVYNLTCDFPADLLSQYSAIQALQLSYNRLSGQLKDAAGGLANLGFLHLLDVYGNKLSGTLDGACDLVLTGTLTGLNVGSNAHITGPVPACLFNASSGLTYFSAQEDQLGGALPADGFTDSTKLQSLYLSQTGLTGSVPASLAKLPKLEVLDLGRNSLEGSLPDQWGSKLRTLVLSLNKISGALSFALANHPTLEWVDMESNQLTKLDNKWLNPDPAAVTKNPPLSVLKIPGNNIQSEFPASLAYYPKLVTLFLQNNQFQGSLPNVTVGQFPALRGLNMSTNAVSGPIPSSWNNSGIFQLSPATTATGAIAYYNFFLLDSNQLSGPLPLFLANSWHAQPVTVSISNNANLDLSACSNPAEYNYLTVCTNYTVAPAATSSSTAGSTASAGTATISDDGGLSAGAIAGIVIGTLIAVALLGTVGVVAYRRRHLTRKSSTAGNSRFERFDEEGQGSPKAESAYASHPSNPYSPSHDDGFVHSPVPSSRQQRQVELPQHVGPPTLSSHWQSKTRCTKHIEVWLPGRGGVHQICVAYGLLKTFLIMHDGWTSDDDAVPFLTLGARPSSVAMIESVVAYYINQYLGQYVEGIDAQSLRISILAGNVQLRQLQLKPEVLAELNLPICVKAGLLGSLTLKARCMALGDGPLEALGVATEAAWQSHKLDGHLGEHIYACADMQVPWSALGRVPVEVSVDRLFLLATPRPEEERTRGATTEEEVEKCFQRSKQQRVAAQEARWKRELEKLHARTGQKDAQGQEAAGGGGMFKAVIETVIGNLQLSITNVHVRYEDAASNPGHPFACGFTLDKISGYTVDEAGQEAFVTSNPLQMLRKASGQALLLRRLALYFDTDAAFWDPGASWHDMELHHMQRQERGGTARNRQYVLRPVEGRAHYTRRGARVERKEGTDPVQDISLELDTVALRLTQPQYQSYHMLLSEVSTYSARLPHMGYRPKLRPAAGQPARVWWAYAVRAVLQQLATRRLTWSQAVRFARLRKRYVPLYLEYLRKKDDEAAGREVQGPSPARLANQILELDKQLPENTMLMFRRLAYTELQRERRRAARAADTSSGASKGSGGGWYAWLRGGRPRTTSGGAGDQAGGADVQAQQPPELTSEDYGRLLELVSEQDKGLQLESAQTPFTLLAAASASVSSASAVLVAADGTQVLRGGLEAVAARLLRFPETLNLTLGVTAMGLESPEGVFVRTGAEAAERAQGGSSCGVDEAAGSRALLVAWVHKPQDGSADAVVEVVLTPSYVHYSATTIDRVALDFSNLAAQATTQLERARKLAAQYAAAALQSKPRLRMRLCLDAPKVAIPTRSLAQQSHRVQEGTGPSAAPGAGQDASLQQDTTLVLDFGRFVIESDPKTAASLQAEEAALYECVRLRARELAAYVADGQFDWSRQEESRLVPLLERTGLDIGLQAARFLDPGRPTIRLQPVVPMLHFYLSPGRLGRLLRVLQSALPSSEREEGGAGAGGATSVAAGATDAALAAGAAGDWRDRSDYQGPLRVLVWGGLGRATISWCPRYGVLYQGTLYLLENSDPGAKVVISESVWPHRRVVRVPPDKIGGAEHVVALCSESVELSRLAEDRASLALRFDNDEAADTWLRQLMAAQASAAAAMQAAEGPMALPEWDETSSSVSASDAEERERMLASMGPGAAEQQATAVAAEAPRVLLQVDAKLGELAVFCSGREPDLWWPPPEVASPGAEAAAASACAAPVHDPGSIINVDGEVALVVVRASGGVCGFSYGAAGMTIHTALGSLEVEDLLVGQRCPGARFLARSSAPAAGVEVVGEDLFFDPDEVLTETPSGMLSPRHSSGPATPQSAAGLGLGPASAGSPQAVADMRAAGRELAEFTFTIRRPGTKEYEGVDTQLDVVLSSLFFYCNRPTVAALITMGVDMGVAASAAFAGPPGDGRSASPASEDGPAEGSEVAEDEESACATRGQEGGVPRVAVRQAAAASAGGQGIVEEAEEAGAKAAAAAAGEAVSAAEQQLLLAGSAGGAEEGSHACTLFRMSVTLSTLQVVLNYEGEGGQTLAQASMERFSFGLDIAPDTTLTIQASLGNVRALDTTLPPDHPCYQACGLKSGGGDSLISVEFVSYPPSHDSGGRAPPGRPHSAVRARLCELQLVFLYRFLQEVLQYISTMLAMRSQPLDQQLPAAPTASTASTQQQQQQPQQQPGWEPLLLLLDVEADAPVVRMPRSTDSLDAIEVDLGQLALTSSIQLVSPKVAGAPGDKPLLLEVAGLTFTGVGCRVVTGGRRGDSVVQNAEDGWRLGWRRPLLAERRGRLPSFDFSLDVPLLRASLSDEEYQQLTSIAAANTAEPIRLPAGAGWLNDHYQRLLLEQLQAQQAAAAAADAADAAATANAGEQPAAEPAPPEPIAPIRMQEQKKEGQQAGGGASGAGSITAQADEDMSPAQVRVAVSLGSVELELRRQLGLPQAQPLARFAVGGLQLAFRNSEAGGMAVSLCVPRVEARDLRPEAPPGQAQVVSSAHKASFLMLEWSATAGLARQSLAVNLQKPLLVAELSFLLAVTRFVVPSFSLVRNTPLPFVTHDLALLPGKPHMADGDLWLSPCVRLLADTLPPDGSIGVSGGEGKSQQAGAGAGAGADGDGSCGRVYEYDGQGHRLLLPAKEQLQGQLPLVLVGPGSTLRLRNARLANSQSLALCLQLAPGARLLARPEDGVELLEGEEEEEQQYGATPSSPPTSPHAHAARLLARSLSPRKPGALGPAAEPQAVVGSPSPPTPQALQALQRTSAAASRAGAQKQQQHGQQTSIEIVVSAVGLGLQFVQIDGASSDRPPSRAGGVGSSGSSRQASVADELPGTPGSTTGTPAVPTRMRSIQVLSANMDLAVCYKLEPGGAQRGCVTVQGLRIEKRAQQPQEARTAAQAEGAATKAEDTRAKLRGRAEAPVLEPCRLALGFELDGGGEAGGDGSTTDLQLESSELRLTLSPDVVQLAASLANSVLQPLLQAKPDQPLMSCSQFERVWACDPAMLLQQQQGLAVSLGVSGASGGTTVWRPLAPAGYCPLGDVAVPGGARPSFEVLAVAVNSGLVARPLSFRCLWEGAGARVWRALAPAGYVAVGDVMTVGDEEPELACVLCVHAGAVVESALGQCLVLPPRQPQAPAATAVAAAALPPLALWCVDNSMATFLAATPDCPPPRRCYDLRSPLGVPPAALLADGAAELASAHAASTATGGAGVAGSAASVASALGAAAGAAATAGSEQQQAQMVMRPLLTSKELQRWFYASRRQQQTEQVARVLTPTVVDFRRVWYSTRGDGVSMWRPVAPAGYCSLGDCLVRGLEPPPGCAVVQDSSSGKTAFDRGGAASGAGGSGGGPLDLLVRPPHAYECVWQDVTQREDARLAIWRPIPPPGYVAMGCVASAGIDPPPRSACRCLRADAATRATPNRSLIWRLSPSGGRKDQGSLPPLSCWMMDERLATFWACPTDRGGPPPDVCWRLGQVAEPQKERAKGDAGGSALVRAGASSGSVLQARRQQEPQGGASNDAGVNVVVKTGKVIVLLKDAFRVPLLELELGAVQLGLRGPSAKASAEGQALQGLGVMQAYVGVQLAVWAYNSGIKAWEPVVEPWSTIVTYSANFGHKASIRVTAGIEPGTHVTIKSSTELVHTTLAFSTAAALLAAYSDWQQLRQLGQEGAAATADATAQRQLLAAADGGTMRVVVDNRLGVSAAMELDYGDHMRTVALPAGSHVPVDKPVPAFPTRQGDAPPPRDAQPHPLLLLDIQSVALADGSSGWACGTGRRELYCIARLEVHSSTSTSPAGGVARLAGKVAAGSSIPDVVDARVPIRTRALPISGASSAAGEKVEWAERLVLPLPPQLPAEATLIAEVWDAAAAGGRGVCLAASRVLLAPGSLRHRQAQALELDLKSCAQAAAESAPAASISLHGSYMLQLAKTRSRGPADGWGMGPDGQSTTGQRALSLGSQEGTWAVIPAVGQQRAVGSSSAQHSGAGGVASLTAMRVGSESVVVERCVAAGVRREVLRSLCQVSNTTALPLEVCLVDEDEDAGWQEVAARAGSVSGSLSADLVEEEVFENERWLALKGWSPANLLPTDPPRYQYARGGGSTFPTVHLPAGWEWESQWHTDSGAGTDEDGWAFGPSFAALPFPPPPGANKPGMADSIRRRRIVRLRRRLGSSASGAALVARTAGSTERQAAPAVHSRKVVGVVEPGALLPLPLGWDHPGRQLQLRPVLSHAEDIAASGSGLEGVESAAAGQAAYNWSASPAGGQQTLLLDAMDESITRLVCCQPQADASHREGGPSTPDATPLWFSITIEYDLLAASASSTGGAGARTAGEPVHDWRVVVAAPLSITNQLPMPASLIVWEDARAGGGRRGSGAELVSRQTVQVGSGQHVQVHTANVRCQVSITFYPEGYDWADAGPALITQGFASHRPPTSSAAPGSTSSLPDRFRLVRSGGGTLPVEVFVQRNVEMGAWLLAAKEELDPGDAAAMGVPLSVSLLAPLWLANSTELAVDAVIVQVPPVPPPSAGPSSRVPSSAVLQQRIREEQQELRVLVTDSAAEEGRVEYRSRRCVGPHSMELLSYPLPSIVAAPAGSGSGAREQRRQQRYGVRLRVAGSGWTPPLALDILDALAAAEQMEGDGLRGVRPVLIRAWCRQERMLLRLEPHVVASNRTEVPLQLLLCTMMLEGSAASVAGAETPRAGTDPSASGRSASHRAGSSLKQLIKAPSRVLMPRGSREAAYAAAAYAAASEAGAAVVPTGGASFTHAARSGDVGAVAAGTATLVRPSAGSAARLLPPPATASMASITGGGGTAAEEGLESAWERVPSVLPDSTVPLVALGSSAARSLDSSTVLLELGPGDSGTPLHLPEGMDTHTLCFRCSSSTGAGGDGGEELWSRPIGLQGDDEQQFHLLVPLAGGLPKSTVQGGDGAHLTARAGGAVGGAVAIVRVSVLCRGLGGIHLVVESAHSDPPYLLENRTPVALQYRQAHVRAAPFHSLSPWSAVGYVFEFSPPGCLPRDLELQEGQAAGTSKVYALEAPEGQTGSFGAPPLQLSAAPRLASVALGYWQQTAMGPGGLLPIGGEGSGVLGRGGIDRVLQVALDSESRLAAGAAPETVARFADLDLSFELPGVELSVVDATPQELLLVTVSGLRVLLATGDTPTGPFRSTRLCVERLQVDDQLWGSPFPVAASVTLGDAGSQQALLRGALVSQSGGGARGRGHYPYIGVRCALAVQLALSETLIWRALDAVQRLQQATVAQQQGAHVAAGGNGLSESGGQQVAAQHQHEAAAADVPLHIRLLSLADLVTEVSFQGDPLSRPRDLSGGLVSIVIDLANFQAAPVTLRGLEMQERMMLASALAQQLRDFAQGQLFSVGLSLVRNFGVIGGASRVLGALSAGVAKLAATRQERAQEQAAPQAKPARAITDVGDGMLEGASALGSSLLRGLRGLVEKPLAGAQQGGVGGAVKGAAMGILGAVANPVSGMLDALSATAEGFDASFGKPREAALVLERRRLPRVVGGDGRLQPLARIEALGQALLKNTLLSLPDSTLMRSKRQDSLAAEAYEEHFVLPDGRVLVLTSRGLMLVHAHGFAALDGAVEVGAAVPADVPPGQQIWFTAWDDVLAFELRWSDPAMRLPNHLIVHRKGVPGLPSAAAVAAPGGLPPREQEWESLAHLVKCFENTPQAGQLKLVAEKVLKRYYLDPLRRNQQWQARHAAAAARAGGGAAAAAGQQMPLTLPSLDFVLTWHTNPQRQPLVSFWRPVAPQGYRPVGDVATLGMEPPATPAPCFRDDVSLRLPASALPSPPAGVASSVPAGAAAPGAAPGGAPTTGLGGSGEPPPAQPPRELQLIWRHNGRRPVTVWMPVAPPGYAVLGAVVRGAPEMPSCQEYLCVYALEAPEGQTGSFGAPPLQLSAAPRLASVALGYWQQTAMGPGGLLPIGGEGSGVLGRGGIDRVLQVALDSESRLAAGAAPETVARFADLDLSFELPGVELSVVDATPQELLLVTVSGLRVLLATGDTPTGPFRSTRLCVERLQVDDQLWGSPFPVAASVTLGDAGSQQALLRGALVSQSGGGARGRGHYPYIGVRCALAVQLALSETLIWRALDAVQRLQQATVAQQQGAHVAAGGNGLSESGGQQVAAQHQHEAAAADVPLHIRLLSLADLVTEVSFQGDPLSRPRSDLTVPSRCFNSAIWSYEPPAFAQQLGLGGGAGPGGAGPSRAPAPAFALRAHHPETWKISVWQVDNRLGTFIAVRSLAPPPPGVAYGARCIEERAARGEAGPSAGGAAG
eukprot:scaffold18.g1951.t1